MGAVEGLSGTWLLSCVGACSVCLGSEGKECTTRLGCRGSLDGGRVVVGLSIGGAVALMDGACGSGGRLMLLSVCQ